MWRIYAVRYAHLEKKSSGNFLGGDAHDVDMPLDYYVWVIANDERTIVLDTGFDSAMAVKRGRRIVRPVEEGLRMIGVDHAKVADVIISHMHYDHCGNHALFPNARFHLQDAEMDYATGRCMCHHALRHPFDVEDVTTMVRRVFDGRVCFHSRESILAPGVTLHHVGGHSRGLQVVRVDTERGPVVLASDAAHFYANIERGVPFPVMDNVAATVLGMERICRLAASNDHVIPGHDPLVLSRYPRALADTADIVRLDVPPIR